MNDYHWFADEVGEVNWKAKCEYDREFVEQLYSRLLHSHEEFTHGTPKLNLLISVSGGLDSSVVTWCMIDMVRESVKTGRSQGTDIALVNFASAESNHAEEFYTITKRKHPDIPMHFFPIDIKPHSQRLEKYIDNVQQRINTRLSPHRLLSARLRDTILLEMEERLGYCWVDTLNMTEYILGEFTTGPWAYHLPVFNFYKSVLYDIARLVDLPEWVRTRRPVNGATGRDKIADYFGEVPSALTPEDVFKVLDPVLYRIYVRGYSSERVAEELGHSKTFTKRVEDWIKWQKYKQTYQPDASLSQQFESQLLRMSK